MTERIFAGRTAVVTGGARGIGRSICQMLAERGARVAVNFERNQQAADETVASIADQAERAIAVQADVSQSDDVDRMMATVREQLGPIDFLVNNAGIATTAQHEDLTFEDWKRMFDVNVDGPFLTTWAVKDEMIERQFGRIVNVSSLAGIKIKPDMIHYATTKSALISFTRHCAQAFAADNIRVNCVAPGLTDTDITRNGNLEMVEHLISITPMNRMAEPNEIATVVKFLLSDDSSFVTGQTVPACGGRC